MPPELGFLKGSDEKGSHVEYKSDSNALTKHIVVRRPANGELVPQTKLHQEVRGISESIVKRYDREHSGRYCFCSNAYW